MKYAFLGNMNNMAYIYAREMKRQNLDVTLFVDVGTDYMLDRPEGFDNSLTLPYPDWIIDIRDIQRKRIKRLFLLPLIKHTYLRMLKEFDVIILNGDWISLGKYIDPKKKVVIFFGGFDMDILADYTKLEHVLNMQPRKFVLKYFRPVLSILYNFVIYQQRAGIKRADGINYYPSGINPEGDVILKNIKNGMEYKKLELRGFPFYDAQYESYPQKKSFVILNFTRFDFCNNDRVDNKRNDIMIEGIADFIRRNDQLREENLEIIFFEKGYDLSPAKELCDKVGISKYVKWQKPVTQKELKAFIVNADVVFDQLGRQWLGYGIVAMSMGRAVIANGRPEIFEPITGEKSPLCNAVNVREVSDWLTILYNDENEKIKIGKESSIYIQKHYDIRETVNFIVTI